MSRADGTDPDARPGPLALRGFERSLPMLLLRCHQAVMAEFRPLLRAHGITEQQWRVLRALTTADSLRLTELAALTLISAPSLTRIVRALEDSDLIRRQVDTADQRAARVSIRPAGRRLIERVAPHSEDRYRDIARRFGQAELDALYRQLERLPHRLGAARGTRSA